MTYSLPRPQVRKLSQVGQTGSAEGTFGGRFFSVLKALLRGLREFRENDWSALGGIFAGFGAAYLAARALASLLYGTSTRDPLVFIGSALALTTIAGAASLLPAVRAAKLDPLQALRTE